MADFPWCALAFTQKNSVAPCSENFSQHSSCCSSWCRTFFCAFPYSGSPSPSCTRCCALSCTHSGFRQHRPSCDKLNLKSISGENNQNHQNYLFSNSCLLKRHCVLQLWAADLPLNKFSHKDTQLRTEMRTNQFCTPQQPRHSPHVDMVQCT